MIVLVVLLAAALAIETAAFAAYAIHTARENDGLRLQLRMHEPTWPGDDLEEPGP
jgi:hypothetical protein